MSQRTADLPANLRPVFREQHRPRAILRGRVASSTAEIPCASKQPPSAPDDRATKGRGCFRKPLPYERNHAMSKLFSIVTPGRLCGVAGALVMSSAVATVYAEGQPAPGGGWAAGLHGADEILDGGPNWALDGANVAECGGDYPLRWVRRQAQGIAGPTRCFAMHRRME